MKTANLLFLLVLGYCVDALAAGEILFLSGKASVTRAAGGIRIPALGDRIEVGDTLASGRGGEIHVRMDDAALLALRPESRLKIEAYRAQGLPSDRVELRLYEGSVRSVTGWIGRDHPERYVVHTPGGDIGVKAGCDHEPMVVTQGKGAGTYDRVHCGISTLETPAGRVDIEAGNVAFAPLGSGPDLLPSLPARYRDGRNDGLLDREKSSLEGKRDAALKARRAETARSSPDAEGKPRIASFDDARQARLALDAMLRAYEQGDLEQIRSRLDPSLIGYQRLLDDMATDIRLCKQIRFHLRDTQVQAGPDVAIVQTHWEKRCILLPDFKPVLITGNTAFLLHKTLNTWALAQFERNDSTLTPIPGSGGALVFNSSGSPFLSSLAVERISRSYANASGNSGMGGSPSTVTADGLALTRCSTLTALTAPTPVAANIEVIDADRAGTASVPVVITNAQGERETFTLNAATPGGSRFILPGSGTLPLNNHTAVPGNGVLEQHPAPACVPWIVTYSDPLTPTGPQDVFVVVGP